MAISFPTGIDELTNPTSTNTLAEVDHAAQHANTNDILEALESKVGVTSSAVETSLDYKVAHKQDALGFTAENAANKKTTLADNSDTYYPTQKAVKTAVDGKMANPMTTAGDTLYGGADGAPARLAKGTAGQVLKMNAGATAPEWGAASGGFSSCFRAYKSAGQDVTAANTATKVTFDTESFDINNEFASSTFTPSSAGYYQLNISLQLNNLGAIGELLLYKNGSMLNEVFHPSSTDLIIQISDIVYSDGNDYFEVYIKSSDPSYNIAGTISFSFFSGCRVA